MLHIYVSPQDRYILATMVTLATICFWHGLQTVLPIKEEHDFIALVIFVILYVIYNLQFVCRILAFVSSSIGNTTRTQKWKKN